MEDINIIILKHLKLSHLFDIRCKNRMNMIPLIELKSRDTNVLTSSKKGEEGSSKNAKSHVVLN